MAPVQGELHFNGRPPRSLAIQIERGLELLDLGRGIEDQDQFHIWRGDRNLWLWEAAEALGAIHDERVAEAFRKAISFSAGLTPMWQDALPREIARVRAALVLLRRFQLRG